MKSSCERGVVLQGVFHYGFLYTAYAYISGEYTNAQLRSVLLQEIVFSVIYLNSTMHSHSDISEFDRLIHHINKEES